MTETLRNWAGNIAYSAKAVHRPTRVAEVQELVSAARQARALGSRHCFNTIADSDDTLISTAALDAVIGIDSDAGQARIAGGITYGQLCPALDAAGFALPNLASLPHISVIGAATTATHGAGVGNANLAVPVAELKIVTASGEIAVLKRGDADFNGAVVGYGALGVVVEAVLDLVPRFDLKQNVFRDLPATTVIADFDAIMSGGYSVSLFTRWTGDSIDQVWIKDHVDGPDHAAGYFGARPAEAPTHPLPGLDPAPCTEQMGVPGPWHARLPHFRLEFTPSAGAELQSEYFVARHDGAAAFEALQKIQHRIAPHLLVSEIRAIAADALWMSPAYEKDCIAFHFTWKPDWPGVRGVLPEIEAALAPFGAVPHAGKLFTMDAKTYQARFQRLAEFRDFVERFDPAGKFRNAFVGALLF